MVTTKALTYDHLKSRKKPVTRSTWIALDSEIADEHEEAVRKRKNLELRHRARPEDKETLQQLADAQEEEDRAEKNLRDNSVRFTFRSIGRKKYEKLVTDNPPTPSQIKEVKKDDPNADLAWNPEVFVPLLIAKALVDPALSEDEVMEMFDSDEWNSAELGALYMAAFDANSQRRVVELGNGSRGTQPSKSN